MPVNLLAISVGNTRDHIGLFVDGSLDESWHAAVDDSATLDRVMREASARLEDLDNAAVYIASVNDPGATRAMRSATQATRLDIERVGVDIEVPIGRQLEPESIVGVDRLLNVGAAYDRLQQACIVVDAGTAVTVDFVDGAGTFHGGAILPGARMMLQAMAQSTDQLPEVELTPPDEALGHNTSQAMLTGVFHGIRGAVRELVEKYAETYGAYPSVIATGGDAELLFSTYELVEGIVPDLTLLGMAVTRRYAIDGKAAT